MTSLLPSSIVMRVCNKAENTLRQNPTAKEKENNYNGKQSTITLPLCSCCRSGRGCHARPRIDDSWVGMDRMGGTHSHHTGCIPHSDKIRRGLDTYLVWTERA